MGANFAPSIANLFMGEWEEKTTFSVKRDQLLRYRRYIDDLFFVCSGPLTSSHESFEELNRNTSNIRLTSGFSKSDIFLTSTSIGKGIN